MSLKQELAKRIEKGKDRLEKLDRSDEKEMESSRSDVEKSEIQQLDKKISNFEQSLNKIESNLDELIEKGPQKMDEYLIQTSENVMMVSEEQAKILVFMAKNAEFKYQKGSQSEARDVYERIVLDLGFVEGLLDLTREMLRLEFNFPEKMDLTEGEADELKQEFERLGSELEKYESVKQDLDSVEIKRLLDSKELHEVIKGEFMS